MLIVRGTDAGTKELAKDVSAMANTAGGMVVIGVDDSKQDHAHGLAPFEPVPGRGEEWVRSVLANWIQPPTHYEYASDHADSFRLMPPGAVLSGQNSLSRGAPCHPVQSVRTPLALPYCPSKHPFFDVARAELGNAAQT